MRADLNFLNEWGRLMSSVSFEHLLPTLRFLQEHKAKKIILLGTAQSVAEGVKEIFDMQRIGDALQAQLKLPVLTLKRWTGADAAIEVDQTPPDHIVLLGNIGADPREKEENEKKRQALADEILEIHPETPVSGWKDPGYLKLVYDNAGLASKPNRTCCNEKY